MEENHILEGYLQKQSPNIFKNFQQRYFIVENHGRLLCYYPNKKNLQEQLGAIPISINSTDFNIETEKRKYILRAETEIDKLRWIEALNDLINKQNMVLQSLPFRNRVNNQIIKRFSLQDLDNEQVVINSNRDSIENNIKEGEDYQNNNSQSSQQSIESEQYKTKKQQLLDGKSSLNQFKTKQQTICNNLFEFLKARDLYFEIKSQDLISVTISGLFQKKGKDQGTNFKERFFFMISNGALKQNCILEKKIENNQLPKNINFSVIYYYNSIQDTSLLGQIDLKKSQRVNNNFKIDFVNNFEKQNGQYCKIYIEDRIYILKFQNKIQRIQWIYAIRAARVHAIDPDRKVKDIIDEVIDNYEKKDQVFLQDQGYKKFNLLIKQNMNNLMDNTKIKNIHDLRLYFEVLQSDLLESVVILNKKNRFEVAKQFFEIYNEKILDLIKSLYLIQLFGYKTIKNQTLQIQQSLVLFYKNMKNAYKNMQLIQDQIQLVNIQ